MRRKVYGSRPKTVAVGRETGNAGMIYHAFRKREESMVSHIDKGNSSRKENGWNIDRSGNFFYTCGD